MHFGHSIFFYLFVFLIIRLTASSAELAKFNQLAHNWWDPNSEFKPLHEINPLRLNYIDQLARLDGKEVLDVGCGNGYSTLRFAEQYRSNFSGIDFVPGSVEGWSVADQTTAELMLHFYRHLRSGLPKDEALRAAQLELIRGPVPVKNRRGEMVERDLSLPYYWAAFQVIGDWR